MTAESKPTPVATVTLSTNSYRNNTFDSDEPPIHYQIICDLHGFKTTRYGDIYRRDNGELVLYAQWEKNVFKQDRIRFLDGSTDGEFVRMVTFLQPLSHNPKKFRRQFISQDGRKCTWKNKLRCIELYIEDSLTGQEKLLASYHQKRYLLKKRDGYVDLYAGYKDVMDLIIPSLLYCMVLRKKAESASGGG